MLSFRATIFALLISFLLIAHGRNINYENRTCPCSFPEKEYFRSAGAKLILFQLCLQNFAHTRDLSIPGIRVINLNKDKNQSNVVCDMIIIFKSMKHPRRRECPGICHPIPMLELSIKWISNFKHYKTFAPICSYDSGMFPKATSFSQFLEIIFYRRIQECYEQKEWNDVVPSKYVFRRKVQMLIIWIGTTEKQELMSAQQQVLNNYTMSGTRAFVGWQATEVLYACIPGTETCYEDDESHEYLKHMPPTFIGHRRLKRNAGWACAQRRPLRALAHTLLLFDAEVVIIADDDTYVNLRLITSMLSGPVRRKLDREPIVLGEPNSNAPPP